MTKEIFREISARVTAFIYSNNKFLVLKLPTGAGKTTTTLKTLNQFKDLKWIYTAPFHHIVHENLEMSVFDRYDYIHLKSRAKLCVMKSWRRLAEKHIDISPICEHKCPKKDDGCPYYEAKEELREHPKNWAGVHHHLTDFLRNFVHLKSGNGITMGQEFDFLIIDENPIGVFFINKKTDATKLLKLKGIIKKIKLEDPNTKPFVNLLDFLILNFSDDEPLDHKYVYKLLNVINFTDLYDAYQVQLLEAIVDKTIDVIDVPPDYIGWFGKIQHYSTPDKIKDMIVKKEASGYTHKHYYLMCFVNDALQNLPFKIIALDGTANIDIWETLVGVKASVFDRPYVNKDMYQLTNGEYPLSSWLEPKTFDIRSTGKRLCKMIDLISSKKKNKVLIICNSSLVPHIRKETDANNLIYGYYYFLRSRNDFYKVADTVIIASQSNIPEFQIDCFAKLSDWDKEVWRKVFTDEEMIQGVGRIRQGITVVKETKRVREKVEVFIFPAPRHSHVEGKIIELFPDAELYSYNELYSILEEGGVEDLEKTTIQLAGGQTYHELWKEWQKETKLKWSSTKFKLKLLNPLLERGVLYQKGETRRKIYKLDG